MIHDGKVLFVCTCPDCLSSNWLFAFKWLSKLNWALMNSNWNHVKRCSNVSSAQWSGSGKTDLMALTQSFREWLNVHCETVKWMRKAKSDLPTNRCLFLLYSMILYLDQHNQLYIEPMQRTQSIQQVHRVAREANKNTQICDIVPPLARKGLLSFKTLDFAWHIPLWTRSTPLKPWCIFSPTNSSEIFG